MNLYEVFVVYVGAVVFLVGLMLLCAASGPRGNVCPKCGKRNRRAAGGDVFRHECKPLYEREM